MAHTTKFMMVLAVVAAASLFAADHADARMGRGGSFGSRGARTYQAPPVTQTAPNAAAPMQRSITQPGMTNARPGMGNAAAANRFGRFGGFTGGLLAGFLGAGLLGMLFGGGFFGGLGGMASILGLLLQIGLIVIVARLVMGWLRQRQQPQGATAGGPQRSAFEAMGGQPSNGGGFGGAGGFGGGASQPLEVTTADLDRFEALLGEIQTAWGKEDLSSLRRLVTPEMLSFISDDLADNASRGVVNEISEVHLLQGDPAESWREGDVDYATVAMRFSAKDVLRERSSGDVVEGDPDNPAEATELWTFRRARGGDWILSAVQQA